MLRDYFVVTFIDADLVHQVHHSECILLPEKEKMECLGFFSEMRAAVLLAESRGFNASACHQCLNREDDGKKT